MFCYIYVYVCALNLLNYASPVLLDPKKDLVATFKNRSTFCHGSTAVVI